MKFWNKNWNIPAFLIFNIILFSGLFYYDLHKNINVGSFEAIGSVSFKINSIQRKFDSSVVWQAIAANTPLKNKDTIRTLPESDAIIRLNDGTEIQVDENSMVYLDMKDNVPNINFEGGSIQINNSLSGNPNQQIVLRTNNQILKLNSGNAKIESNGKDVKISLDKGSATLEGNGKSQNLNSSDIVTINDSGISKRTSPFILEEPTNQKKFISKTFPLSVDFLWKPTSSSNTNNLFELSKLKDFKKVDVRMQNISSANLKLTPGTYYWRVGGKNASDKIEYSETRKILIINETGLQLFSPPAGSVNPFKGGENRINFSWTPSETVNEYYVEIANNSSFTSNFKIIPVSTNSISLDNLSEGTYFWRVITKPSANGIPSLRSNESSFIISAKDGAKSFELISPADNSVLPLAVNKNQVAFQWNPSTSAKKFRIQVSSNPNFKDLLVNEITTNTKYTAALNKEGTYYWKVAQFFGETQTAFSSSKKFTLTSKSPEELKEEPTNTKPNEEISQNENKDKEIKPKEVVPESNSISNLAPQNISPVSGKIDISKQKLIRFHWDKVKNASYYNLKIFENNKKSKMLLTEKTTQNSYILKNFSKLSEGAFLWEVTPFDKKNKSGKTARGKFSIDLDNDGLKKLKPEEIKILSPDTIYRDK